MKKSDRIQSLVNRMAPGASHNPFFLGYFRLFNEQKYYEAHDVLEHLWLQTTGPGHQFLKGLIQLAGAFVHLQKQHLRPEHPVDGRRIHPAWRLFKLARHNLSPFTPHYFQYEVSRAVALATAYIAQIEANDFKINPWRPADAPRLEPPAGEV